MLNIESQKTQIKAEITAQVLRFLGEIIVWSEDNLNKILSSFQIRARDALAEQALRELECEGIIRFIGSSDIFLVPHPNLLEHAPQSFAPGRLAAFLQQILGSRLAQEA